MTQKQFYKSMAWKRARESYIDARVAVDGGMCEVCRNELGRIVHHKIWLNDDNCNDESISLNSDNFRYECQTCHNKEKEQGDRRTPGRVQFDEDGNIIESSPPP